MFLDGCFWWFLLGILAVYCFFRWFWHWGRTLRRWAACWSWWRRSRKRQTYHGKEEGGTFTDDSGMIHWIGMFWVARSRPKTFFERPDCTPWVSEYEIQFAHHVSLWTTLNLINCGSKTRWTVSRKSWSDVACWISWRIQKLWKRCPWAMWVQWSYITIFIQGIIKLIRSP